MRSKASSGAILETAKEKKTGSLLNYPIRWCDRQKFYSGVPAFVLYQKRPFLFSIQK
jgi:hypothetical protein